MSYLPSYRQKEAQTESRTKPKIRIPIHVGIDFGTSFTKVAFNAGQDREGIIKFTVNHERTPFFPSLVYYDPENDLLSLDSSGHKSVPVRYFKFAIIDDSKIYDLKTAALYKSYDPSFYELCSVFYLAQVIKIAKREVPILLNLSSTLDSYEWNFTMGVPLDNFEGKSALKGRYDKILNTAVKFAEIHHGDTKSLRELSTFYQEFENDYNEKVNTLPELYAEALDILKSKKAGNGLYIVVDIGGGTVDMACLRKSDLNEGEQGIEFISQTVTELGLEILLAGVNRKQGTLVERTKALSILNNAYPTADYLKQPYLLSNDPMRSLQIEFRKMLVHKKAEIQKTVNQFSLSEIPYSFYGGGATVDWYANSIKYCLGTLERGGIRNLVEKSTSEILRSDRTSQPYEHRLVIAKNLARRYDSIPRIEGFPWDFPNDSQIKPREPEATSDSNYYRYEDRQRELYGN